MAGKPRTAGWTDASVQRRAPSGKLHPMMTFAPTRKTALITKSGAGWRKSALDSPA
jgi:hypothetical protein